MTLRPSFLRLATLVLLAGCGDDSPATDAGTSSSTGRGTSTTDVADTSTGLASSTGAADSTGSTTSGSSTTSDPTEGSSTTDPAPVDPDCPGCIVLVAGSMDGRGLSLHADLVYFTDQAAGTVSRVAKGGGAEVELLVDLQEEPYDVVANDTHVFWTTFVEGGNIPRAIVVDETDVFWSTRDRVVQQPKP